jgi:tetratricopeptide (TPR) repeat protein
MYKWIIILLLTTTFSLHAKENLDFLSTDSITYQCYLKGDWDKLISTGKQAIAEDIDYKKLRQRMGYAYFVKQDYFAAKVQYEMALKLDETDADTRSFLYYCGMYIGDEDFARFHAAKLSDEIRQSLDVKRFKLIDAVDLEFNKKTNNSDLRSNPIYSRFGVNTRINYRLSLYQSVSKYSQGVVIDSTGNNKPTTQSEYYGLLRYNLTANTNLMIGYHYLKTVVDTSSFSANLYYGAIATRFNRFTLGANGSYMKNKMDTYKQMGVSAGYNLPSKRDIYLKSSVNYLKSSVKFSSLSENNGLVFSESVGGRIFDNFWGETTIISGNLKNYNDNNGLYIYNTLDATTFRAGLTLFWNVTNKITLFGNYSIDQKKLESTITTNYNQQSFLGGIRWKL